MRLLEKELQPELHDTAEVRRRRMQECCVAERWIQGFELRVIEHVEIFPTEFERALFVNLEALEQSKIEIQPAGLTQIVAARIAEGQAGRIGESRGIIEERRVDAGDIALDGRVWIADLIH